VNYGVWLLSEQARGVNTVDSTTTASFHVDHVIPLADHGQTEFHNLALACVSCSLRKGARRCGRDPQTGQLVNFFHPREERWTNHFECRENEIVGRTAIGRATIDALALNRPSIIAIRSEEHLRKRWPPSN